MTKINHVSKSKRLGDVYVFDRVEDAIRAAKKQPAVLFRGKSLSLLKSMADASVDLIVTSPPYCIGKSYETTRAFADFVRIHQEVLPECVRVSKPGGSLCWQVGYHVGKAGIEPLDFAIHEIVSSFSDMHLRNRIVWSFGHGTHSTKRFSGRHETIMWYTKGKEYAFDIDNIRIPQKYPGKRHYKGPKKGHFSGHPLGKNPGDLWDIPNVKAHHVEKTKHPCQFPVALAQRLIRALTTPGQVVLDPFIGSGSTAVAARLEKRRVIGADRVGAYLKIATSRILDAELGTANVRPLEQGVYVPKASDPVAIPPHFRLTT